MAENYRCGGCGWDSFVVNTRGDDGGGVVIQCLGLRCTNEKAAPTVAEAFALISQGEKKEDKAADQQRIERARAELGPIFKEEKS